MRVISGSARGRMLQAVPGKDTRPTTDKVKESVFNILQFRLYDAVMLDLFAGTGQMGIEALSRGAARAVFVDCAPKAISVIRRNIAAARVEERAEILNLPYQQALQKLQGQKFDILFLDPPYGGELLNSALKVVESFDILSSDGIIICESSVEDTIICPDTFAVHKTYRYGTICLTALCRKVEND
ncbi:MAG: 16S rRNA (guanine(966)-N(2))-methyltransferase RsmD [Eubacteriales bacterium]|nr:16S rRNA (guanine(966)-N(2))-methyltransferase RsmD [Eubacteriales bacterium]